MTRETSDKVIVAPLPLLGAGRQSREIGYQQEEALSARRLGARRYIFYPTANRPNKQFSFLLQLFAGVRMLHPDMILVLTGDLNSVPGVNELADLYQLRDSIVQLPRVDEGSLRWLYEHAAMLCLTSTLEGNFRPRCWKR